MIVSASLFSIGFQGNRVTHEQLENYANKLIIDYNQSLTYFYPETFSNFDFYSNRSYEVTIYDSSKFGTAILFNPSTDWSVKILESDKRVEDKIFGPENSLMLTKFLFQGEDTGFISNKNGNNSITDIGMFADERSTVLFKGVTINSIFYDCLIIKGSNQSSYWDNYSATKDAKRIFDADLLYALNCSEDVRERYAEPDLSSHIATILIKWNNAINSNGQVTYTASEKEHDLNEVIIIAETKYGITNANDFVHKTYDYLKNAALPTPTPEKTVLTVPIVDDAWNWKYVIACSVIPSSMFLLYSVLDIIRKKYTSNDTKIFIEIITGVIALPFITIIYRATLRLSTPKSANNSCTCCNDCNSCVQK